MEGHQTPLASQAPQAGQAPLTDQAPLASQTPLASQAPLANFHYPLYAELPNQLLFIGQVVDFVNEVHIPLSPRAKNGKVFTDAMATNYVKRGLTPPAIGRRYGKDHLALILFASTAKLCFCANDVMELAHELFPDGMVAKSHDEFACAIAAELKQPGSAGTSALAFVARSFVARCATFECLHAGS